MPEDRRLAAIMLVRRNICVGGFTEIFMHIVKICYA